MVIIFISISFTYSDFNFFLLLQAKSHITSTIQHIQLSPGYTSQLKKWMVQAKSKNHHGDGWYYVYENRER